MHHHGRPAGRTPLIHTIGTFHPLEPRRLLAYTIDTGFAGGAGAAYADSLDTPVQLQAVAVAPSGKVWAGGTGEFAGVDRAVLVRFNANGTVDDAYADHGLKTVGVTGSVRQIRIHTSGALLLAGDAFVAKMTSAGAVDASFGGGDGIVPLSGADSISLDASGVFYVATDASVRKYKSNGTLDTAWASSGVRKLNSGATATFFEAAAPTLKLKTGPYNRLVIGIDGTDDSGMGEAGVIKLNASGSLDTGFSDDGIATLPTLGSQSLRDVLVLADTQTIVLLNGEDNANAVYAFTGKGTPKSILGSAGDESSLAPVELRGGNAFADEALSIIEQPGGTPLIVGGFADAEGNTTYGAAMRLNGGFTLDNAFAIDGDGVASGIGVANADGFDGLASSVAATSDSIYLLQRTPAGGKIVRLRESDATFPVIRDGGKVLVSGTSAPDDITITADSRLRVGVGGERFATRLPQQLIVEAGAGDDHIVISETVFPSLGMTVRGAEGNDRILSLAPAASGTSHRFQGGDGRDDIRVATARSVLFGDADRDTLYGSTDNDAIFGGDGNDFLAGGSGDDYLEGNGGHDILDGSAGNDRLIGHGGNDVLIGGKGNDSLYGFSGLDTLKGGVGADYFDAGPDNDLLDSADSARDTLFGGSGSDSAKVDDALDLLDGIENLT